MDATRSSASAFATPAEALSALRQVIRQEVDPNQEVARDVERLQSLLPPERLWVPSHKDPAKLRARLELWPELQQIGDMAQYLSEALGQVCAQFPEKLVSFHPKSKQWPIFADQLVYPLVRYTLCEILRRSEIVDLLEEGDCEGGSELVLNEAGLRVRYVPLVSARGKLVHPKESLWTDHEHPQEVDPVGARTLIYWIERAREEDELECYLLKDFGLLNEQAAKAPSPYIQRLMKLLGPITDSVLSRYWPKLSNCLREIFGQRVNRPDLAQRSSGLGEEKGPQRQIPTSDADYKLERCALESLRSTLQQKVPTLPAEPARVYTLSTSDKHKLQTHRSANPGVGCKGHDQWIAQKLTSYLQRHKFAAKDSPIEQHGWMEELTWDPDYESQRLGLVAAALIPALLNSTASKDLQSILLDNDPTLTITDSKPHYALLPATHEVQLVLSSPCEWAPQLQMSCCPRGIEPVSALALLLNLRSAELLEQLDCLLLQGFHRKGSKALLDAAELRQKNSQLDTAYSVLQTLAACLVNRYGAKIREALQPHFNIENLKPFVPQGAQDDCSHLIHYGLDWEIPELVASDPVVGRAAARLKSELSLIFNQFSDCAPPSSPWPAGEQLYSYVSRFYQLSHAMSGGSCRVGSMAAVLYGHLPTDKEVRALRRCMGDFLASPAGSEHFAITCKQRGIDIATAALHYREGRSAFHSDIEYAILAWTLNVRVGIFADGYPTEKEPLTGMILPSGWHGPDSKIFLSFFCTNNFTFYGAHPKWRVPKDADRNLRAAISNQCKSRGDQSGFFF